ncbi:hypothetical protein HanHA300_Chr12g0449791 [Helianthus annuus]|nr:hypothetical protein HanHA300_Chr12g0449791 [Helianthus annuus]KAJ0505860.1 hypothetical protein HanHA89_Chr12g0475281 [Helianthus annuus]KAJ0675535.1 hypothetical protein HanLR1_Chr12g0452261 [Helianthus annuus]
MFNTCSHFCIGSHVVCMREIIRISSYYFSDLVLADVQHRVVAGMLSLMVILFFSKFCRLDEHFPLINLHRAKFRRHELSISNSFKSDKSEPVTFFIPFPWDICI